ncbi:hypothetical protein DFP72DRAFT_884768 [Ephemerocybe angulata]|uniref:Uncharacterized protein n=1 Tax=Ephemerocybe angulata TaxID=980116 RepID=A0A8H6M9H1_9AGAR|nr:hypothetical protein DFP72DRAFT_884768 [Tulosesus angulatus]
MFYTLLGVLFSLLFSATVIPVPKAHAAFTTSVTSGNDTSAIEQNDAGSWCYYPAPAKERTVLPSTDCIGDVADFRAVMLTHIKQTQAILYYSASLEVLGGADFLIASNPGKTYLCYSGKATDGMYETGCEVAQRDNQFGLGKFGNRTVCLVENAQTKLTDGCYAPVGTASVADGGNGASSLSYTGGLLLAPALIYILATHLL